MVKYFSFVCILQLG